MPHRDPEDLDQGWIPSAFGAVPPDAETVWLYGVPTEPFGSVAGFTVMTSWECAGWLARIALNINRIAQAHALTPRSKRHTLRSIGH